MTEMDMHGQIPLTDFAAKQMIPEWGYIAIGIGLAVVFVLPIIRPFIRRDTNRHESSG